MYSKFVLANWIVWPNPEIAQKIAYEQVLFQGMYELHIIYIS